MAENTVILIEVGAVLLGMSLLGRLAALLRISAVPLYLLAGLAFGNGTWITLEASSEFFELGSSIGVILLLALLGLEYSAEELLSNVKRSRLAGILDLLFNALPGAALALLLGWGPEAAFALAGVTWVSSSGVIAKVLRDLGRLANRETPTILAVLVIEDLAMAFYLPLLTIVVMGATLAQGSITMAVALGMIGLILFIAYRHGPVVSRIFPAELPEPLLLGVLGLTMLVSGLAAGVNVSSAVGAFLVGIALSGKVAENASTLLTPLRDLFAAIFFVFFGLTTDARQLPAVILPAVVLALVTMATKVLTGYLAARRANIAELGRWRTGFSLTPRGEFSIVIAGLAVAGGATPALAPLATTYVLITVVLGPLLARLTDIPRIRKLLLARTVR